MRIFVKVFSDFSTVFMSTLIITGVGGRVFNVEILNTIYTGAINGASSAMDGVAWLFSYGVPLFQVLDLIIWPIVLIYIIVKLIRRRKMTTNKRMMDKGQT